MKRSHIIWIVIVVLVAIIVLLSLRSPKPAEGNPIVIGSISALSGVGASTGEEERRGAELAVIEINKAGGINGRPLRLVSEDVSLDKIKVAASVAQKLVSVDNVVAIVGAQWDEPTEPILPIIEAAQVPMIGADTSDQLEKDRSYEYFFSTWYDNRVGIRELLRYSQKRGITSIAIVKPIGAGFWEFTASIMKAEAPSYGITIVDEVDLGSPLLTDFRTPLTRVKGKNPGAIFIATGDFNQCQFVKQVAELGITVPTLGTEASGDQVSLRACADQLTNRFFSTPIGSGKYNEFVTAYEAQYGTEPLFPSAVTAYDAVYVIATALEKTNGEGGPALRDAIAATDVSGASLSRITFNEKGFVETPESAFEIRTTKDGKFVPVKYK